jgi:hypothetical protein
MLAAYITENHSIRFTFPQDPNNLLFTESLLHIRLHVKINMKTHSAVGYKILSRSNPQAAVDDLKGKFGRPTQDIPGVVGKKSINNQSAGK